MPHVSIKLWPGRSEEQKKDMAEKIKQAVMESTGASESYISIAIEEVDSSEWGTVYRDEIMAKEDKLYKKPDYTY